MAAIAAGFAEIAVCVDYGARRQILSYGLTGKMPRHKILTSSIGRLMFFTKFNGI
jgi:hypothetical protein